uniref:Acetate kinase n=1 Tax=Phenylobacterium glaciei TaxID=2803784 RepID=A0A974P796_9CAUL|nr:hypothetical protein JKL49_23345 [Phenylobacterium glaciei]
MCAIGHRIVHGGADFSRPVLVDDRVLARLEVLSPLAPLHQPHNLAAVRLARSGRPGLPQVACFDTAFHHGHASVVTRFALPRTWHEQGVRRYGFHGLSYEFIADELRGLDPALAAGRVIVAHLGNGASLCAIHDGRSVDTTMGFTALDGLMMGTRCGALDPGVILYLQQQGLTPDAVQTLLYEQSGLLGSRACRATCGCCWPVSNPRRRRRWSCSCIASFGKSAPWPLPWAAWTASSSPQASARTRRPFARASPSAWAGPASRLTARPIAPDRAWSAPPKAA